jgi:hypothetical protein
MASTKKYLEQLNGPYRRLCERVKAVGGTIRLLREGVGWGLVVTLPSESGVQPRAGGFVFCDLDELDRLAGFLLGWLDTIPSAAGQTADR